MIKNMVQNLTNEKWSSEIERIFLPEATAYHRKLYFNQYFNVYDKVLRHLHAGQYNRKKLIDVACGDGAGSAFIAEQFPNLDVLAVDIDKEIIEYATKTYASRFDNLRYMAMSMVDIEDTADVVISLETIEHVERDVMLKFLEKVSSRMLKPGGKFVVSTPRLRPRESTVKRPSHINELYYDEFKYILAEYFPMMEFYSFDRYVNVIPDTPDANFMVAVCSKFPATDIF